MRGTSCNCLVVVRCAATPSFNFAFRGSDAKTAAFECVHACSTHVQKQSCEQCMNSVNIGIAARKGVLVCIHFEGWVWFSDYQCAFGRSSYYRRVFVGFVFKGPSSNQRSDQQNQLALKDALNFHGAVPTVKYSRENYLQKDQMALGAFGCQKWPKARHNMSQPSYDLHMD